MSSLLKPSEIQDLESISTEKSFELVKLCSVLLYSKESTDNEHGRRYLVYVLNNWQKIPEGHHEMWNDLLEAAGFYPYISSGDDNSLTSRKVLSTAQRLRLGMNHSSHLPGIVFHEEQKEIADILASGQNVIISAPTSFGKSILIEEVVASKKYSNIVIIQPTLALLDETRKKLKKYEDSYKLIVKTSQEPSQTKGNLFLLTAERVMEYAELPLVDFFILDEFYKLSAQRDDERSDTLNNAFHLLLSHNAQFYLLGPNIDSISKGFTEKYNAKFIKTTYSLVENNEIDIYSAHKDKFEHPRKYAGYKESVLFELLVAIGDEQTIIYCSSPDRARKLALQFTHYLTSIGAAKKRQLSICSWIRNNIHNEWGVSDALEHGIGVHDGALPRHMTSAIIKYFNEKTINYLFCTSTIIEGVNTSAKNVVLFDSTKGGRNNKIDFFDYSNIKGRSGRMMVHYIGNVYNFCKPPKRHLVEIDIPFFDQNNVTSEVLIHLDKKEVKDKSSEKYKQIEALPEIERKIIQKNGMSISGQKAIISILEQDILQRPDLVLWSGTPTYDQLKYAVSLSWDNLIKPGESTSPFTKSQVTYLTHGYGMNQSLQLIVENQITYLSTLEHHKDKSREEIINDAVKFTFQAQRHWFSYKVPKWLLVLDRLQKYVAQKHGLHAGDYTYYASQIENDFIQSNLSILNEYGVPRSAIKKVERYVNADLSEDDVIPLVKDLLVARSNEFDSYEIEKLNEIL